ncbi:MAG: nicotinamidase-related amidase [Saprospiraceae bacterium]|jgi:nicotinamidase-related amidase
MQYLKEIMKQTALLLIDVQEGLDDPSHGERNNPDAEANMSLLLNKAREWGMAIIHIRHDSAEPNSMLRPGAPGNQIKSMVLPIEGEALFAKSVNSAFIGTDLEAHLHTNKLTDLVVVGLTTDHCVSTSVRMAANLGFNVTLVEDAVATHSRMGVDGKKIPAQQMHDINLASLNGEFCTITRTDALMSAKPDAGLG